MDKLLKLPFAELEALRQYFTAQLANDKILEQTDSRQILTDYHAMVCQVIDKKFEDLITAVSRGSSRTTFCVPKKERFGA